MATAKKNTYINVELDWAENQLKSWKEYVESNPVHELNDRISIVNGKEVITATVEQQGKFLQETMKNYLSLTEVVDKLREKEESKLQSRGNAEISSLAEDFLNKK